MYAIALLISLNTASAGNDPTRAKLIVNLMDTAGRPIELIRPKRRGDFDCEPIDWAKLEPRADVPTITQRLSAPWCVVKVDVTVGKDQVTLLPFYHYHGKALEPGSNTLTERGAQVIRQEAGSRIKFSIFPRSGAIIVRTRVSGRQAYIGEFADKKYRPGKTYEEEWILQSLPQIQVITEVISGDPNANLLQIPDELLVYPRKYPPEPGERQPASTGEGTDYHRSLAGTWIVEPGEFSLNSELIPAEATVMIRRNDDVARFDALSPLVVSTGDSIVVSIGPTVE